MTTGDDVTIGEVGRRIEQMATTQTQFYNEFKAFAQSLPATYVSKEVFDERFTALMDRVEKLENTNIWITRLVLGLVIMAVISVVLLTGNTGA